MGAHYGKKSEFIVEILFNALGVGVAGGVIGHWSGEPNVYLLKVNFNTDGIV